VRVVDGGAGGSAGGGWGCGWECGWWMGVRVGVPKPVAMLGGAPCRACVQLEGAARAVV
jgi:hypothetical protein